MHCTLLTFIHDIRSSCKSECDLYYIPCINFLHDGLSFERTDKVPSELQVK
jgi:hypothetical protein